MRICLYTSTALPKIGGQEITTDALARAYQGLGHEVVVLAPHPRLPLRARDDKLPYRVVRHTRLFSTRYFVELYGWWLRRLHRQVGFDVVHCLGVYPHGYLAIHSRARLGVPVVVASQGDDIVPGSHRLRCPRIRPRIQQAIRQADHLVAISSFTRDGYLALGADARRITVIANGVDRDFLAQPVTRPVDLPGNIAAGQYVLFLGRLVQRKGVDVLLSALARVPQRPPSVELVIAGAGDERESLEGLAQRLGLADRVCFVGAVAGATKAWLLQNARCLAVPSRTWEAQGMVVLEAYAAGVPVLASDLKGMADLIEPDRTGWLVPPEDPAALAEPLAKALAWPVQSALRAHVQKVAARHTWSAVADRHIELFFDLQVGGSQNAGLEERFCEASLTKEPPIDRAMTSPR